MKRFSILKQPILSTINDHLIDYPSPSNLNYFWNFGSLAGLCLIIQIATGIFLAMHYTPHVDLAFLSVEHIMRDVEGGWLLRYMHANGASMFFLVVYLHIFRGLYYASYSSPRELVWCMGVIILLLMIITAFIGYVLPWGQMSFWGATVITSLASAIPVVGDSIVTWLWGGFSVDNATLNRFYSLHYLLPFIIAGASIVHIAALHQYGSNNPLGTNSAVDKVSFYPYFYVKDLVGWVAFAIFFLIFVYFVALLALPFINTSQIRSSAFRPIHKKVFRFLVADCVVLVWIGQQPVENPYIFLGQLASLYFFVYFLLFIPILGKFEPFLINYKNGKQSQQQAAETQVAIN